MVMRVEPIVSALEHIGSDGPSGRVILLSPQGRLLDQQLARKLAGYRRLILVCGRYEGVDERIRQFWADDEISIGDYILSGGELAALVLIDVVSRLVEGVVGNILSIERETFQQGLLKYPQYTRPRVFRGKEVPEVLISGNHAEIERWRRKEAIKRTRIKRPDLLSKADLTEEDRRLLEEIIGET